MLSFVQNLFAAKANPIGVDFGSDTLRLAQVQRIAGGSDGDEYKLIAAASADVPSHIRKDPVQRLQFFTETARDLLAQGGFRGRQAILALPAASMFIQHLRMARMSDDEIKKALPWEARGQLPIDPSHALLRHIIAGEIYQEQEPRCEVVLLAAVRGFVDQLLAAAAKAKLDIIGMNVEPKAIIDCFTAIYRRKSDASATSLFVDIGAGSTRAVIAQARQIHFARAIAIGGDHFNQAAAAAMHSTFEETRMIRMQGAVGAREIDSEGDDASDDRQDLPADANTFALLNSPTISAAGGSSATAVLDAPSATFTAGAFKSAAPASSLQERNRLIEQSIRAPLNKLIDELNLCRRYHESTFPNRPVDRLIFVGGEARQRSLCAHIACEMGLAAQVGDPLVRMGRISDVGIESGIDRRQPQPNWSVSIGLSIGPGNASTK